MDRTPKNIDFLCTLNKEKVKIPDMCVENIVRILNNTDEFKIKYDNFTHDLIINNRKFEEFDIGKVQSFLSINYPFLRKVSQNMVYEGIYQTAKKNEFDSAKDYFRSLVWDETPRIDTWLSVVYGTPDDEYHTAVGSNFLKGIVKRVMVPGCKFDYVFTLEGKQGAKKSTSLAVLGGDWYVETTMSTETKDFFMQFQGNMIIEFSEGETMSRTETKRMKAIVTTQVDKFRPPYEKTVKEFKRRCVFTMTTNDDNYLKDDTGNRRWLPVALERAEGADIEWLKENRDQLYAEAYHRVMKLNETIYEFPDEETARQQSMRQEEHPWHNIIEDWFWNTLTPDQRADGVVVNFIYDNIINKGFAQKAITRYDEMIIGTILKRMGMEKRRVMRGGARINRFFLINDELISTLSVKEVINGYEF